MRYTYYRSNIESALNRGSYRVATRRQTFRLYPNKKQEKALFAARRLHCYLYNACISHRQFEYKSHRKSVSYFDQQNLLPAFKAEWKEFAMLNSQALQSTVSLPLVGDAIAYGTATPNDWKLIH